MRRQLCFLLRMVVKEGNIVATHGNIIAVSAHRFQECHLCILRLIAMLTLHEFIRALQDSWGTLFKCTLADADCSHI